MRRRRVAVAWVAALPLAPLSMAAQGQPTGCVRMTFGVWTPPLDWQHNGHPDAIAHVAARLRAVRDSVYAGAASAQGRDEMQWLESRGTRQLLVSPAWWPAGVLVTFDAASRGDTLDGDAIALVADGARAAPRARARVIRRPCNG
ncbi:MAG: hypothetical protein IT361_09015 [Gemmatimonadaceae bacterium]|nr:hypothetical protein [Gemmatimonadaceae bacterium]